MLNIPFQEKVSLGSFEVGSGKLIVSDPYYSIDILCHGILENVKNGIWNALVTKANYKELGTWCTSLVIWHTDTNPKKLITNDWIDANFRISVDSGQAGFFDLGSYRKDSIIKETPKFKTDNLEGARWYNACCDITLSKKGAGIVPRGTVSESGFGNGDYECKYLEIDGICIAAMIIFLTEEEINE